MSMNNKSIKGLSLFANVGLAETYLYKCGIEIVIANEIDEKRASFYNHLYPNCNMICGDITDEKIFNEIINESKKNKTKVHHIRKCSNARAY